MEPRSSILEQMGAIEGYCSRRATKMISAKKTGRPDEIADLLRETAKKLDLLPAELKMTVEISTEISSPFGDISPPMAVAPVGGRFSDLPLMSQAPIITADGVLSQHFAERMLRIFRMTKNPTLSAIIETSDGVSRRADAVARITKARGRTTRWTVVFGPWSTYGSIGLVVVRMHLYDDEGYLLATEQRPIPIDGCTVTIEWPIEMTF